MVNYAQPWTSADSANAWRNQTLNPLATSPRAGTTGTTGWGSQQTNAPGWTGNANAWNTSKAGAPVSMFGGAIGGSQLGDVYTTQPVGPTGYPTTNDTPRQPVPARPNTPAPTYPTQPGAQYPGAAPGGWNPNLPNPYYTPGNPMNLPNVGAQNPYGYDNTAAWWANRDNANAMASWLPYGQYEQNRWQYTNDFNEAQRRYDAEMAWRQQSDQYNMGLAGRQQQMAEWQANEAARQWNEQFGYTQQRDTREFQLANDQLAVERAYRQGLISNEQRNLALQELTQQQNNLIASGQLQLSRDELAALQQWRNTEAGLRQNEIDNNLMAARYSAFGRAQAPGQGKFQRNW